MEARVPRYFFNVHDAHSTFDADGSELSGHDEARLTAVQFASEIMRDEARRQSLGDCWQVEVLDGAGTIVCCVDVNINVPIG